jgi:hypothetical protein
MILGTYDPTYGELLEDQWLLKLRDDHAYEWDEAKRKHVVKATYKTGFLTKLTKKGELPKSFESWGGSHYGESGHSLPIYVFQENYRTGWKLISWRFGKSQNWARMKHPEGFIVEIYLDNFLDVVKETAMDQGEILDEYKWVDNKLVMK